MTRLLGPMNWKVAVTLTGVELRKFNLNLHGAECRTLCSVKIASESTRLLIYVRICAALILGNISYIRAASLHTRGSFRAPRLTFTQLCGHGFIVASRRTYLMRHLYVNYNVAY
jgi:uncharacterized membrane protein YidH (DUF202 family)